MPVLSSAEMAEFRTLNVDLAFHDSYRVQRPTEDEDGRGGRTTTWVTVETGYGTLERDDRRGATTAVAERLGWSTHYDIDLPYDTSATQKDRIEIGGRTFIVGELWRGGELDIQSTAVCQEFG